MASQGSGGAFEISQRMTAMVGWGATVQFQEDWAWDQAAGTYALDPGMAETLRKNNPQVRRTCMSVSVSVTAAGNSMRQSSCVQVVRCSLHPVIRAQLFSCITLLAMLHVGLVL